MRSALTFLVLAAIPLLSCHLPRKQSTHKQAVCEPQPTDMSAVRSNAEAGDAAAEYELGRSTWQSTRTDFRGCNTVEFAVSLTLRTQYGHSWGREHKRTGTLQERRISTG